MSPSPEKIPEQTEENDAKSEVESADESGVDVEEANVEESAVSESNEPEENQPELIVATPLESDPRGQNPANVESRFQAPVLSTIYDGQPFTDLVRNLESFIGDRAVGRAVDQFQPLLNLCGTTQGLPRLQYPGETADPNDSAPEWSRAIPLRHIHSTPLVHTPSILDDEDEDEPPPLGLEILSRSRSTPLSTSANSAFGSINRLNLPYMNGPDDRSAFTLPPYRLQPSRSNEHVSAHLDLINPIAYEVDRDTDPTAIEVMDVPVPVKDEESKTPSPPRGLGSKTAARAAKFLSEMKNISRRRKPRSGRENPARPPSVSDESSKKSVVDDETLSSKSSAGKKLGKSLPKKIFAKKSGSENASRPSGDSPDSSGDSSLGIQSPSTVASAPGNNAEKHESQRVGRVRIQISQTETASPGEDSDSDAHLLIASPTPSGLPHDASTLTPQTHDSPDASRSYATQTSGHVTHATTTSYSSGHVSQLSSISETDREVMEVNKVGKHLKITKGEKNRAESGSTPTPPRYPGYIEVSSSPASLRDGANVPAERFFTMVESASYRLGLNGRLRTASSLRRNASSQSPTTVSSSSMTTNSSATGSSQEEPPKFVSYLDRKTTSDLTSLREADERSSPRAGGRLGEERESSPHEMLGYSDVIFEEAKAPGEEPSSAARPRPIWPNRGFQFGRKVRSLPPRSPHKTPSTPPPRSGAGSPAYDALSPPREIVDHRIDPNVSRPYVLRSTPASTRLLPSRRVSPEVLSTYRNVNYAHIPEGSSEQGAYEVVRMGTNYDMSRSYYVAHPRASSPNTGRSGTYNEHSIEILKTDSKEESPTFVTPERCPSN